MIDLLEVVYGDLCQKVFGLPVQFLFLFDWSMGHQAFASDALNAKNMNVSYGGKQPHLKETTVPAQALGPHAPSLQPGDVQKMTFQPNDPPPFYKPNATDYVGKPKGLKVVLKERGLWTDKMRKNDMVAALEKCDDFIEQKSVLHEVVHDRGHILDMSPKFACEMAGVGVEYSWGRSKLHFRKHCTQKGSDLRERVKAATSEDVVPLFLVRKYARITRDYMRLYRSGMAGPELEKIRKKAHTHRSALDTHRALLNEDHGR